MFLGKLDQDSFEMVDAVMAEYEKDGVEVGDKTSLPVTGGESVGVTCTQVLEKGKITIIEFTYDDDVNNVVHFKIVDRKLNSVTVREHTINGERTKTVWNNTAGPREPTRTIRF
jgi:hypothetical protein